MNRVHLFGRLGADPEYRETSGGTSLCKFRLATTERVKKGGEWKEETEWHSITVWGSRAKPCSQYLTKGSSVCVLGRLRTSQYEKEGQKHYSTEIVADVVEFGELKRGQEDAGGDYSEGGDYGDEGRQSERRASGGSRARSNSRR